jgi:DeoR family myo-inositol catabolism operon transcriptional repressor
VEGSTVKLQRIQKIEEYVKKHGSVSLDDLCKHFDVSRNTIRRDIHELETRRIVKKVYGGVVLNNGEAPIPLSQRQMTMKAEKIAIAKKASEFVNDGDVIVIDAGSTTVQIVEHLKNKYQLTLITNSVPVLNAVLAYEQLHIIVTGGDLLRPTNSFVGHEAAAMLKKLNANTVFLAATGVSLSKGITNSSTIETEIKKAMMEVSEQIVLLVDHTKFDTVSLVTFADLKDIDILITDQAPPPQYFQYCAEHAVEIIVANP